ncbi:MAG: phage holin family protein, partial [Zoogloea sp.]|nr:phage holin family protein [Zoogloea sp.]
MSDSAPSRLGESLKGLADSGLATVQTRLELFAVELKEEKLRAGSFLFETVLAALFVGFGIVFLLVFITVLLWESHRLLA